MEGEHLRLDDEPGLLLAHQLGDQRQIQALTRMRRSLRDPRQQLVAQRMQIGALEGLARQLRKADTVGIVRR